MYNNNIITQIRRLALMHYYYRIPSPIQVLPNVPQSPLGKRIQVRINHVLLLFVVSFGLECVLSVLVFHNLEAVDEKWGYMGSNLTG